MLFTSSSLLICLDEDGLSGRASTTLWPAAPLATGYLGAPGECFSRRQADAHSTASDNHNLTGEVSI